MKDRFKYRAKLKDMDKWVYGAYLKMLPYQPYPVGKTKPLETEYKHLIVTEGSADWGMPREIVTYEVIPETVGQCLGFKDKNDNLIYEGDIVQFYDDGMLKTMKIVWDDDELDFKAIGLKKSVECYGQDFSYLGCIEKEDNLEVISNIYENSELLKEES